MNLQEKMLEASTELRARAAAFAASALQSARRRARLTKRLEELQKSITVLAGARRAFGKVARRHVSQFVKQNSTIASAVSKDVAGLARSTYASLSRRQPATRKARRAPAARRRTAKAA
jgi:hypothetical protein